MKYLGARAVSALFQSARARRVAVFSRFLSVFYFSDKIRSLRVFYKKSDVLYN